MAFTRPGAPALLRPFPMHRLWQTVPSRTPTLQAALLCRPHPNPRPFRWRSLLPMASTSSSVLTKYGVLFATKPPMLNAKIFLETCKQYKLNPFTKEAYLIHYDNKNEDTASTIVLGKNCYLQMAERNPAYDGFEAGVIVLTADGQLLNREGSIVYDGNGGETLLGGWAKVYRKDRTRASYEEVKLSEYDTGKSLWNGKKATMIRKVALVHALREAFPSTFGALYDESEVRVDAESTAREVPPEDLPVLDPYAAPTVTARRRHPDPCPECTLCRGKRR